MEKEVGNTRNKQNVLMAKAALPSQLFLDRGSALYPHWAMLFVGGLFYL